MLHSAVEQLLAILPEEVGKFKQTEYPLPIKSAFLGEKPIHCSAVRKDLIEKQNGDLKDLLEPLLLAAELYEASCQDNEQYFLTDNQVQSYVFSGSKWKAGWVLVLGGIDQEKLVAKFQEKNFLVFTDQPNLKNTVYIGSRATCPIYFLQLMVRYGMVWRRDSNPSMKPGFASVNFEKYYFPSNSLSDSSLSNIREFVSAFYPVFCAFYFRFY